MRAALRNSAIGDKNLVNGMSRPARAIVNEMMNGREGTAEEVFRDLEDMIGKENVPNAPARPRPQEGAAIQAAPATKPSWMHQDVPRAVPRSERAVGMRVKHPSFGLGEVQDYGAEPGKMTVKFDKDQKNYNLGPDELTSVSEVSDWEEIGPLQPGDKLQGQVVRNQKGHLGRIRRPGESAGSALVDTDDGRRTDVWWQNDLMEVRPKKPGQRPAPQRSSQNRGGVLPASLAGEKQPFLPGGMETPPEEPSFDIPQGFPGNAPGRTPNEAPVEPGEYRPGLLDEAAKPPGPGENSPDFPGSYFPKGRQRTGFGPGSQPKSWVGDDGHEYGWETDPNSGQRYMIDYGVPEERPPGFKPTIYKSSDEIVQESVDRALRPGSRHPRPGGGRPGGGGRPSGTVPPRPAPGAKPKPKPGDAKIPKGPSNPRHEPPSLLQPPAPANTPEGVAQGRKDAFMIQSRNWLGNAQLTPDQKSLASQILHSKDPDDMTADERQFMKDAYGPMWEKTAARAAALFPNLHQDARKFRKGREGLSIREKARAVAAMVTGHDNPQVYEEWLHSEIGLPYLDAMEKAYGNNWRQIRNRMASIPDGSRKQIAQETMDEVQKSNWGSEREEAERQVQRLQDIFGSENVVANDLDHPTVQQRLIDFAMMDDRQLKTVAEYWDRERRRQGPGFGQIHVGNQPLSTMDDFRAYLEEHGLHPQSRDDRAGIHLLDKGIIMIGTEDTSSASVAVHEIVARHGCRAWVTFSRSLVPANSCPGSQDSRQGSGPLLRERGERAGRDVCGGLRRLHHRLGAWS